VGGRGQEQDCQEPEVQLESLPSLVVSGGHLDHMRVGGGTCKECETNFPCFKRIF
jgi:hypothetical protein